MSDLDWTVSVLHDLEKFFRKNECPDYADECRALKEMVEKGEAIKALQTKISSNELGIN